MFNRTGIELFRSGVLSHCLVRLKNKFISDGCSAENAEFAISAFCYSVSVVRSQNADNVASMLTLDTAITSILGDIQAARLLKRATSIALLLLDTSFLNESCNVFNLVATSLMSISLTSGTEYIETWVESLTQPRLAGELETEVRTQMVRDEERLMEAHDDMMYELEHPRQPARFW